MVNIERDYIIWKLLMNRKIMMCVVSVQICFDKDISMFD